MSPVSNADRALAIALRSSSGSGSQPDGLPDNPNQLATYQQTTDAAGVDNALLPGAERQPFNPYSIVDTDQSVVSTSDAAVSASERVWAEGGFDVAAASFDQAELIGMSDVIKSELNDTLKRAVKEMLSGVVNERLGNARESLEGMNDRLEQVTRERVEALVGDEIAQPIEDAVNEAEKIATELKEEFKRVRNRISDQFEAAVNTAKAEVENEATGIVEKIADLHARLDKPSLNEEAVEDLRRQVSEQQLALADLHSEMKESLARQLMQIVSEATGAYVMPYKDALYTVGEWLRSDLEELELPWLDITDEEDE